MKNKGLLFLLMLLFLICAAAGGYGYYYDGVRKNEPKTPVPEKVKVAYLYYLEDKQVSSIPKNETSTDEDGTVTTVKKYNFLKYSCSNGLTGTFDEEKWEFTPAEEKDSTCSLYFVNSSYSVDFTVVMGTASEDNPKTINREENGEFVITPHEGYEFKDAFCSNGKEATWNEKKNTLTINAITTDLLCKVNFTVKTLTAKITVVNGTGDASENVEYGESINAIVEANEGFEKPKIECTNKQTATFENNKVTIEKLTDNTECKITFTSVPVEKFTLKVELPAEHVNILEGSLSQEIESGKEGSFTIETDEEYVSTVNCGDDKPIEKEIDSYKRSYTFLSMSKNITCKVTTSMYSVPSE